MTNRDRDSAARLLLQVAERLRGSAARAACPPITTEDLHATSVCCSAEAYAIEQLVSEYLSPRPRPPRGRR